jgi:hypothetical protein
MSRGFRWSTNQDCGWSFPLGRWEEDADTKISFLNDVNRIARMDFQPATGDILRARLKTIGIEEHHLLVEGQLYPLSKHYDMH